MIKPSKYQRAIYDAIRDTNENLIIEAVAGSGKCLGENTPVMLYSGAIVPVQDIKPGHQLMGPDSKPRCVSEIKQGIDFLFGMLYLCTQFDKLS